MHLQEAPHDALSGVPTDGAVNAEVPPSVESSPAPNIPATPDATHPPIAAEQSLGTPDSSPSVRVDGTLNVPSPLEQVSRVPGQMWAVPAQMFQG